MCVLCHSSCDLYKASDRRMLPSLHHLLPSLLLLLACGTWCCSQALLQVGSFSAINCSNTLWAFATLRHYHEGLFEALLVRLVDHHLDAAEPQNVANCLYALARVNHSLGKHTGVGR